MMRVASGLLHAIAGFCMVTPLLSHAASAPPRAATLGLPAINTSAGGVAIGEAGIVYSLSDPPVQPYAPVMGEPFTRFVTHVYLASVAVASGRTVLGQSHLLFSGPRGLGVYPQAVTPQWVIYLQAAPAVASAPWTLLARNLETGRTITLDSSVREGMPSLGSAARSDGRTVVWQAWTLRDGQPTSVVRSYELRGGRCHVVVEGGTPSTWAYSWADVAGNQVVVEKDVYGPPARAQVLLADLASGRVRALTPAGAANSEPTIAGDLVAWKVGWRFAIGQGIMLDNLRTGTQRRVFTGPIEHPQVLAGGQIVFPVGIGPFRIELYDATSARVSTLAPAPATNDGSTPGNVVEVGGHTVAYWLVRPSTTRTPNPARLCITVLPDAATHR